MNKRTLFKIYPSLFISLLFLLLGCIDQKKAVYFSNVPDTTFVSTVAEIQPVIHKNDLLSISVSSLNPEATVIFNTPVPAVAATTATGAASQTASYLVNDDGNIEFPILGRITVVGLTKKQLSESIVRNLVDKKLLIDPIVNIRFLNFRVTVLGEVKNPTVILVANEKISILEAIGLAGDLTIYAKRDNVILIREENGNKVIKRLNLNTSEIFISPYYYLKSNDIIYAEPNSARIATSERSQQLIPYVLSSISLLAVILNIVTR